MHYTLSLNGGGGGCLTNKILPPPPVLYDVIRVCMSNICIGSELILIIAVSVNGQTLVVTLDLTTMIGF